MTIIEVRDIRIKNWSFVFENCKICFRNSSIFIKKSSRMAEVQVNLMLKHNLQLKEAVMDFSEKPLRSFFSTNHFVSVRLGMMSPSPSKTKFILF